jgi:hypothetical protein
VIFLPSVSFEAFRETLHLPNLATFYGNESGLQAIGCIELILRSYWREDWSSICAACGRKRSSALSLFVCGTEKQAEDVFQTSIREPLKLLGSDLEGPSRQSREIIFVLLRLINLNYPAANGYVA